MQNKFNKRTMHEFPTHFVLFIYSIKFKMLIDYTVDASNDVDEDDQRRSKMVTNKNKPVRRLVKRDDLLWRLVAAPVYIIIKELV